MVVDVTRGGQHAMLDLESKGFRVCSFCIMYCTYSFPALVPQMLSVGICKSSNNLVSNMRPGAFHCLDPR